MYKRQDYILAHYTHEEIAMAEDFLCPERDELFTYSGLDLLLKRYVRSEEHTSELQSQR